MSSRPNESRACLIRGHLRILQQDDSCTYNYVTGRGVMSAFLAVATLFVVVGWTVSVGSVLWRAQKSPREARVAVVSSIVLAAWAIIAVTLARAGTFQAPGLTVPPVGINMLVVLLVMAAALSASSSLRHLVSRQSGMIRLQGWRVAGLLLLTHTVLGQVPLLFGLPAGVGDVLIGITAFGVARTADSPQGRRRAIIWNALGVLDLVVAVTLGVTTAPGPTQVFHTVPNSALLTAFPLVLVPAFAVPLSLTLHGISLWQLLRGSWSSATDVPSGQASFATVPSTRVA